MLSLLVFPQRFLYSMAIAGAITALAAGLIALTALPALLMRARRRASTRSRRSAGATARSITQRGFWYRLSHFVMRRPLLVARHHGGGAHRRRACRSCGSSSPASTRACCPTAPSAKQVDTALRTEFPPGPTSPLHVAVDGAARRARRRCAPTPRRLAARDDVAAVDPPRFVGDDTWLVEVAPDGAGARRPRARARRAGARRTGAGRRARRRRVGALRRPARRPRRPPAARARAARDHDAADPVRDDGLRRAAAEGARHERARPQRRVRPARAHLPGRPPGGAAGLHVPGRAGGHPAARAARDRVRAEHRLRRLPAHAHQGGARRAARRTRRRSRSACSAPGAS